MSGVWFASLGFGYPFVIVHSVAHIKGYGIPVPLDSVAELGIRFVFLLVQEKDAVSFDVHRFEV